MSERTDAGKPRIFLLNDWLVQGDRVYGMTDTRRFINAPLDLAADNRFHEGGRAAGVDGVSFVLGRPCGRV